MTCKLISKILVNGIQLVFGKIVGCEKAAFIKGRHLQDTVLVAYELVHGYSWKYILPGAMIKVNIRKAYDSVEWGFLRDAMIFLGFLLSF